jgi:hypothetical protein
MSVEEPSLNKYQLELLKLLYTFRFATAELLAKDLGLNHRRHIHARLQILRNLGYIDRYYNQSYIYLRKPAVYYLLPKAFPILKKLDIVSPRVLKNMYKNNKTSKRFVNHNLSVYKACIALKAYYGSKLWFFTANDLKLPSFDYFPKPLPDGFLSIKLSSGIKGKRKYYFLLFCSSHVPLFVHLKQLRTYVDYRSSEEWEQTTNTSLSGILILTDSNLFQQRLTERMARLLYSEGLDEDISYFITTQNKLVHISSEDNVIWQSIVQPTLMRSLEHI